MLGWCGTCTWYIDHHENEVFSWRNCMQKRDNDLNIKIFAVCILSTITQVPWRLLISLCLHIAHTLFQKSELKGVYTYTWTNTCVFSKKVSKRGQTLSVLSLLRCDFNTFHRYLLSSLEYKIALKRLFTGT